MIKNIHDHETRRRSHYEIEFFNTEMSNHNVYYKGLSAYNKIPSNIKNTKLLIMNP